jgi:hypothetical protein
VGKWVVKELDEHGNTIEMWGPFDESYEAERWVNGHTGVTRPRWELVELHETGNGNLAALASMNKRLESNPGMYALELARDLLQMHVDTSLSLDYWAAARRFVQDFVPNFEIEPNGA